MNANNYQNTYAYNNYVTNKRRNNFNINQTKILHQNLLDKPNNPPIHKNNFIKKNQIFAFPKNNSYTFKRQLAQSLFRVHFYLKNVFISKQTNTESFLENIGQKIVNSMSSNLVSHSKNKQNAIKSLQIGTIKDQQHVDLWIGMRSDEQASQYLTKNNFNQSDNDKAKVIFWEDKNGKTKQIVPIISEGFCEYLLHNGMKLGFQSNIQYQQRLKKQCIQVQKKKQEDKPTIKKSPIKNYQQKERGQISDQFIQEEVIKKGLSPKINQVSNKNNKQLIKEIQTPSQRSLNQEDDQGYVSQNFSKDSKESQRSRSRDKQYKFKQRQIEKQRQFQRQRSKSSKHQSMISQKNNSYNLGILPNISNIYSIKAYLLGVPLEFSYKQIDDSLYRQSSISVSSMVWKTTENKMQVLQIQIKLKRNSDNEYYQQPYNNNNIYSQIANNNKNLKRLIQASEGRGGGRSRTGSANGLKIKGYPVVIIGGWYKSRDSNNNLIQNINSSANIIYQRIPQVLRQFQIRVELKKEYIDNNTYQQLIEYLVKFGNIVLMVSQNEYNLVFYIVYSTSEAVRRILLSASGQSSSILLVGKCPSFIQNIVIPKSSIMLRRLRINQTFKYLYESNRGNNNKSSRQQYYEQSYYNNRHDQMYYNRNRSVSGLNYGNIHPILMSNNNRMESKSGDNRKKSGSNVQEYRFY